LEGNYLIVIENLFEAAALLVTLAMASGRFYGLDFSRVPHGTQGFEIFGAGAQR
jgi:hypothetical protein